MIAVASIPWGEGRIIVNIQEPGEWFDSPQYHVFVGGCGVGKADDEKTAREIALQQACATISRYAENAREEYVEGIQVLTRLEREFEHYPPTPEDLEEPDARP